MLKRFVPIVVLGWALTPVLAVAASAQPEQFRTIQVQGFQGASITVQVPISEPAPYALTGNTEAAGASHLVPMRFGQGGLVWVRSAD